MKKRSGKTTSVRRRARAAPKWSGKPDARVSAVFLVGFMGAGKTSVGRALAQQLNWAFEDLDGRIERREGRTIDEIFRDSGEPEFRRAEHQALRELLAELSGGGTRVVALGGGAFAQDRNASLLQAAGVPAVFLEAPVEVLWERCCKQAGEAKTVRPLQRSQEQFRSLFETRRRGYEQAAIRIQTANRSVDEIAVEIARSLELKEIAIRREEGEVE